MATSCFFCATTHDLSEHLYDIPLCAGCRQMERFQILLLQQLCFIQTSLYEIHTVICGETIEVVHDEQEG
jgi:hypothetical protein